MKHRDKPKNSTCTSIRDDNEESKNIYNSHRPGNTLSNMKISQSMKQKLRSKSKPMKKLKINKETVRNRLQELRAENKFKLYKKLKTEQFGKSIEDRLKKASKSPCRRPKREDSQSYLGLDTKVG